LGCCRQVTHTIAIFATTHLLAVNHNNYYFLKHLAKQLDSLLHEALFVEAYSTSKQEIWLLFKLNTGNYFAFKINYIQKDTVLSFPAEYNVPKHKQAQFRQLLSQRVAKVVQQPFERSFYIQFDNEAILLIKLFGKNGNVILFENGANTEVFRSQLKADNTLPLAEALQSKTFAVQDILVQISIDQVAKQLPFFSSRCFSCIKSRDFNRSNFK